MDLQNNGFNHQALQSNYEAHQLSKRMIRIANFSLKTAKETSQITRISVYVCLVSKIIELPHDICANYF